MADIPEIIIKNQVEHADSLSALLRLAYRKVSTADIPQRVDVKQLIGGRSGSLVFIVRQTAHTGASVRVAKMGKYTEIRKEYEAGELLRHTLTELGKSVEPGKSADGELLLPETGTMVPENEEESQTYDELGLHLSRYAGDYGPVRSLSEVCREGLDDKTSTDRIIELCRKLARLLKETLYSNVEVCQGTVRAWYYIQRCPDIHLIAEEYDKRNHLLTTGGASLSYFKAKWQPFDKICEEANKKSNFVCKDVGLGPLSVIEHGGKLQLGSRPVGLVKVWKGEPKEPRETSADILPGGTTRPTDVLVIGHVFRTRFTSLENALGYTNSGVGRGHDLDRKAGSMPDPIQNVRSKLFGDAPGWVALGHGDLHPGNVLIAGDKVFVIDFGHFSVDERGKALQYPVQSDLARLALRLGAEAISNLGEDIDKYVAVWLAAASGCPKKDESVLAAEKPALAGLAKVLAELRRLAAQCLPDGASEPDADKDWWANIFGECLRIADHIGPHYDANCVTAASAVASARLLAHTLPETSQVLEEAHRVVRLEESLGWVDKANELERLLKAMSSFLLQVDCAEESAGNAFIARCKGVARSVSGWRCEELNLLPSWTHGAGIAQNAVWGLINKRVGRSEPPRKLWDSAELVSWLSKNRQPRTLLILPFFDRPTLDELEENLLGNMGKCLNEIASAQALKNNWALGVIVIENHGSKSHVSMLSVPNHPWSIAEYGQNDIARFLREFCKMEEIKANSSAARLYRETHGVCKAVLPIVSFFAGQEQVRGKL